MLKEKNPEVQKIMFRTLSPNEKSDIWREKIDFEINNSKLNNEQLQYLGNLKEFIEPKLFTNEEIEKKSKNKLLELKEKAIYLFGVSIAYKILNSLATNEIDLLNYKIIDGDGDLPNCNCSQSSDYCSGKTNCKWVVADCKSQSGCGTLWIFPCDARCK